MMSAPMIDQSGPSGEQFSLAAGPYTAAVTQAGATLRCLEYDGRPLIIGFEEHQMCSAGRGQHLIPWPNRIRDGRYTFAGVERQLPISEVARHNASHGLVRWAMWSPTQVSKDQVSLQLRLMAQPGYPWSLALQIDYRLDESGLSVSVTARNESAELAPYAYGAHPYLSAGSERIDSDLLKFGASTQVVTDNERLLPVEVTANHLDFSRGRALGSQALDTAFGGLTSQRVQLRGEHGGVELWADDSIRWWQLYSADDNPSLARRALAVEPMTAPPDAFNSGTDLIVLAPGESHRLTWGIRALA